MSLLTQAATVASAAMLGVSGFHVLACGYFRWQLLRPWRRPPAKQLRVVRDKRVSVLMAVRGCDASLASNLRSLLDQDYDDYEVIVVVDHRLDPAWEVVERVGQLHDPEGRLSIYELENPSTTCGLKCSALIQATKKLRPDCEAVVLIDSDVVPHRQWIADAVAPLDDPSVGAVTGGQWHAPTRPTPGSLLRSLWTSGSIVATTINANPWAGTCAMRYEDLERCGLIAKWGVSVVDDGPIKAALAKHGLRVRFEPRLIMINRESCLVAGAGRYITRMLTWSRIYERTFLNTVGHALMMSGGAVASVLLAVACFVAGQPTAGGLAALMILLANALNLTAHLVARDGVRRVIAKRGAELPRLDARLAWRLFWLAPVCQAMHTAWTLQACLVRETVWREITYRLYPRQRVQMVAYRPFSQPDLSLNEEAAARRAA